MNLDIDTMVKECDPCQRYHRSHPQEKVEISHASMFDIWLGHSLHMDFCNFKNNNYCFIVDCLTSYIQVQKTPNQCTESAILAVRRWAAKFRFPYMVIADSRGGLKKDFITPLWEMNIRHNPSSVYHSASNSLAE